jgi:tetraacyldisaccharide 4'-kinase
VNARELLLPLSWLYGIAVVVRNKCFDWGIFPPQTLGVPTISVGNLTVGGTGKTPLVVYIARYLHSKGKRVAILSRGYKRESSGFVLVSDGSQVFVDGERSGDEPQELARQVPGAIVAVDERRARGAKKVLENYPVDVFLLDDGFQHRWLRRDLDIVTTPLGHDVTVDWGRDSRPHLLPAGWLREPLGGLRRANHIVLTRARCMESNPEVFEGLKVWFHRYSSADLSAVDLEARALVRISDGKEQSPEGFRAKKANLIAGIADPEQFSQLVTSLGILIEGKAFFPDHYKFRAYDIESLKRRFNQSGAEFIVTTLKDAVRLSGSREGRVFLEDLPVFGLAVGVEFIYGGHSFHQHLNKLFS